MRNKRLEHSAQLNKSFFIVPLFFLVTVFPQTITGAVTGDNNKPISIAAVQGRNTSRISLTGSAGSDKDVVMFSTVGFIKQGISANGRQSLSVTSATSNSEKVMITGCTKTVNSFVVLKYVNNRISM